MLKKIPVIFLSCKDIIRSSLPGFHPSFSFYFISPPHFMFPILESPTHPHTLPCQSTLLNCSSNGKDGSVEMERIEKRRGGNQWDNRQGRGPGQQGWPLHWRAYRPCKHTHTCAHTHIHTLQLQYVQYTQSEAFAHACSPFRSHSEDVHVYGGCVCQPTVCMKLLCGGGGGAGVMAINCTVLSLLFGANWGLCAGCCWR